MDLLVYRPGPGVCGCLLGAVRVSALADGTDREDGTEQVIQGVGKAGIRKFVPDTPSHRLGQDQPAVAQAGKVVGKNLAADTDPFGQIGGKRRAASQREQDRCPGRVREGFAEPGQDLSA